MSAAEAARKLGVASNTVRVVARSHRIKFRDGRKPLVKPEPKQKATPVQCAARADLSRDIIAKIHRMSEVGHPVGVIEMVTGVRRVEVMRVLGVLDAS